MKDHNSIDVVICGAGAAGLTLAIDLARRGVSFRLIDRLDSPFAGSRGKGIQPRTQEVFEDLGIVDRLFSVGGLYPPVWTYGDGDVGEKQDIAADLPTPEEPYRAALMVPQSRTEAVMRDRLAELGHHPHYGCTLDRFDQDADGVTVQTVGSEGETLRCRYLVGADGGHSAVRSLLGVGFPGKTLGVRAIVADIELDGLESSVWHRFNHGDMARQIALCSLPHTGLFQLQAPLPLEGEADLSVEGLQRFIDDRVGGRDLVVRSVAWASAYGMNARLADRYRVGRVFLIGDAAHIHPPTGGQGLNTSIQDAYNLGWKLGAVLAGAPDALLDSYEPERRPIAAGVLDLSTGLLEKAKRGDMTRGREVHQLDLGYTQSSLSLEAPERHAGLHAGDRMPDAALRGAGGQRLRLFDLLRGPQATLLVFGTPQDLPVASPGVHRHAIGPDGDVIDEEDYFRTRCGLRDGDMILVRPDGYVGAIVARGGHETLARYLVHLTPASACPP